MRQLFASLKAGDGEKALLQAKKYGGSNMALLQAQDAEGARDLLIIETSNDKLEGMVGYLTEAFSELRLTVDPQAIISLKPPASEAADQAIDVTHKSPIEIFLGGLQSIGSWKGFTGYAIAAGIVVWIGLFTETIYLLIAAMLIAPFAGPAMTLALGTARGDVKLIGHSLARYFVSLLISVVCAAGLSYLMGLDKINDLMTSISNVSSVAAVLALTAGAAGALSMCQSERDSMVTAAGPGVLVAASLAPPAGIIGMAATLGKWGMVKSAFFLLLIQLIGINLSGSFIFFLFGLTPQGARYDRGKNWIRITSLISSLLIIIILVMLQFNSRPDLVRSSQAKHYREIIHTHITATGLGYPIEVDVKFARSQTPGENPLIVRAYIQKKAAIKDSELKSRLVKLIYNKINSQGAELTPLIDIVILAP